MPTVSVIIPSYNHDNFIRECLESVLNQSFQDFEIVITDDGSIDNTVDIIKTFSDPRIRLFVLPENSGACIAANNCLEHSRGKYIAMLSSDDAWYPEKLKLQVNHLENHPDVAAVFGKVDWVNEENELITDEDFRFKNVFDVKNRTRFEWLRQFFYYGNCLCHPSSLIRRECYDDIGMFNPALANLPDLDLWVRLCFKYSIHILDEKLVRFRWLNEAKNASADNLKTRIRARFEFKQILNHYLRIKDPQELILIFQDAAKFGRVSQDIIPFFLGRIAIDSGHDIKMLWGLETIYNLMQNSKAAEKIKKSCSFTYLDFIKLAGSSDPFGISKFSTVAEQPIKQMLPDPKIIVRRSRLFLTSSKSYTKNILSAVQILLNASKKYARDIVLIFLRTNDFKSILKLSAPTNKIKLSIDKLESISKEKDLYRLSGRASLQEEFRESMYEQLLVLKSRTRIFLYSITSSNSPDTQKVYQDLHKNITHSDFSAVFSRSVLLPDTYTVGILFKHKLNELTYYVNTDQVLIYSEGQLQIDQAYITYKPEISKVRSLIATVKMHIKDIFESGS